MPASGPASGPEPGRSQAQRRSYKASARPLLNQLLALVENLNTSRMSPLSSTYRHKHHHLLPVAHQHGRPARQVHRSSQLITLVSLQTFSERLSAKSLYHSGGDDATRRLDGEMVMSYSDGPRRWAFPSDRSYYGLF